MSNNWEIKPLPLKTSLIAEMAISSLKVRISRTYLTLMTIAVSTAFIMYLLTIPRNPDPTEQQIWYLMMALSILVSAAGVLNTMLMSVTQRYREIGTMKCLGALDSFILYSVLLEAAMLGAIGAAIGIVIGILLSLALALMSHGGEVFSHLRFDGLYWKIPASALVGLGLSTFGASLPAWIAAKMPPIEAMRGEK